MEQLVSTEWLAAHLGEPDLRILDATVDFDPATGRAHSGRSKWEEGHVPGSNHADLLAALSDPESSVPLTMPSAERFSAAMQQLGVGDGHRVVLYDARQSMWAARVWWMLRAFGFDQAAVLDGGWAAWTQENRPVSTEAPGHPPATFTASLRPGLMVGKDRVRAAIDEETTCIVDALTWREYAGEVASYGRAGHIPSAINIPARNIVDPDTQRFLATEVLREIFAKPLSANSAITYCGGGVAASSDAFVLHLLGLDDVSVYDGSMFEWCADRELPLMTGAQPVAS